MLKAVDYELKGSTKQFGWLQAAAQDFFSLNHFGKPRNHLNLYARVESPTKTQSRTLEPAIA